MEVFGNFFVANWIYPI